MIADSVAVTAAQKSVRRNSSERRKWQHEPVPRIEEPAYPVNLSTVLLFATKSFQLNWQCAPLETPKTHFGPTAPFVVFMTVK